MSNPRPWHHHLTLDLVLRVLNRTLLHPWVAWIGVLSLRAQVTPYTHPAFILTTAYAVLLTAVAVARVVNRRVAYGLPRPVEPSDEVVVVTGGASGLGLLIARVYGLRGASVAVLDVKDAKELEGIREEMMAGVDYYRCDIGNREEVERTARRIEKDLGPPTVLVNCAAARVNGQPLLSLSADAFQRTIQTNLLAVFHTCQVFLPRMLASPTGGTVVNVSSVLGQLCAAGLADYSVSKAGLSALHRTLEAELRSSGDDEKVKLVLVETGQLATPLFESVKTPNSFFAPVLEPVHVAQEIVSAIDEGQAGVIRMPTFASLVNWYAVLPAGLQRIARALSGIDHAVSGTDKVAEPSSQSPQKEPSSDTD
ncbi:putative short-chain dehydrogenase/reductase family protein [Aspergillus steynii IBT 23096]|uniref:Putative short-chain dehydrogenase/reductase family protein n=1 Tax=Aspergillus steynii IBT 23096 TaxID=1392250 RepID=A0A2I2G209_9EURO|nr:putative short-chain dehydrogenase/reductase family protein [Aspergillus steynii IBT 23096]PLB46901.1 putative short-chain dehydrogenase/reductase family protein [Aspergillus steynii IBT 23096]